MEVTETGVGGFRGGVVPKIHYPSYPHPAHQFSVSLLLDRSLTAYDHPNDFNRSRQTALSDSPSL